MPEAKRKEEAQKKPKRSTNERSTYSGSSSLEERVPDGPYVGPDVGGTSDLASRIKGTFKKGENAKKNEVEKTNNYYHKTFFYLG